jgi:hypothetical protein
MNKILVTIAKSNRWWPGHILEQFTVDVPRRVSVDSLFLTNKAKELGHKDFLVVGFVLYAAERAESNNPVN